MRRSQHRLDVFNRSEALFMNNLMELSYKPFMSNAYIIDVIRQYRDSKTSYLLEAIIRNFIKLLLKKARKYKRPEVDVGDLIHYGIEGIIDAVTESFKLDAKEKFITYITLVIERRMQDGLDNHKNVVRFPKNILTEQRKAKKELTKDKEPAGVIYSKLNVFGSSEYQSLFNNKEESIEVSLDQQSLQYDIYRVLENLLVKIEREVIIHSFGLNGENVKPFDNIGLRLGVSTQKVRVLYNSALEKIRNSDKGSDILKKYLS